MRAPMSRKGPRKAHRCAETGYMCEHYAGGLGQQPTGGPTMFNNFCEVCRVQRRRGDGDWCTNDRCGKCHARYCAPGGATSPGHGRRWPEGR